MSKRLSKYIADLNYFDKYLIALSAASNGIFIASIVTVIGAPVRIAFASLSFAFTLTTAITNKLFKTT